MDRSKKIALSIVIGIIIGFLVAVILIQNDVIKEKEMNDKLQKIYDKAYIEGYNKGFVAGCNKTVQTLDSIRNAHNFK